MKLSLEFILILIFSKVFFSLSSCPNLRNIARIGGVDLQFRPGMADKYIPYTLRRQIGDWKAEWFYIDNHAPALPERTPRPPKQLTSGMRMLRKWIRWESFLRELLSGGRRE